ncbi:hypothetical protein [Pseudomonas syringae]|uniref:hypothetical protein n=1 Tax=Pseudomonas syringae TaxID=317 RepID=UPI00034AAC31|nr:hypothetical protein [Pseudomonas syringae]
MNNEQMIKAMEHFYGIPSDMCNVFMKSAWEASWKASREAVVIDLPKDLSMRLPQEVRDICVYWIENAGLKVKP